MKNEDVKIEKRHICNSNLSKTEMWLRNQAKLGWKLSTVKSGVFFDSFVFTKGSPCDCLYFATASFAKLPNLQNTSLGVINYIKNTYGGKDLSKKEFNDWICIKRTKITNIEDIMKNLQLRENCIKKEYLIYFMVFVLLAFAMFVVGLLSSAAFLFYMISAVMGVIAVFPAVKLIVHKINCKKAYADLFKN